MSWNEMAMEEFGERLNWMKKVSIREQKSSEIHKK